MQRHVIWSRARAYRSTHCADIFRERGICAESSDTSDLAAATPLLLEGLKRLEYRGYDSAGIAVMNGKGVETRKAPGKISELEALVASTPIDGTLGIAHTRWATHGAPNFINAHPHDELRRERSPSCTTASSRTAPRCGRRSRSSATASASDTDTEVLAHLIEEVYDGNLEEAVIEALSQVEGRTASRWSRARIRDKIVAARKGSPLLVGLGEGEYFIASDVSAILAHTRQVVYLDDGDLAVLDRNGYQIIDMNALPLERGGERAIDWDLDMIERGGFAHFMLKEIFEQPRDGREHDARPPARRDGHREARRPQPDRRRSCSSSTTSSSPRAARAGTRRSSASS